MSDQNSKGSNSSCTHVSTKTVRVSNFPAKLHFMLNELERDGLEYIASWQQHGRCFIVRNPKEFESKILPCYFQQSKFTSFQRQLSFYGFRRIVSGQDKRGYFHEHFLRGKEEMANQIQRTKIKGNGPRRPNSMESPIPNFYEMSFLPNKNNAKTYQTVKDTHENISHGPSMKTFEANIPADTVSTSQDRSDDDNSMERKSNQERLRQIELLNGIDRDLELLARASYNIQNYVQAQKSCQGNHYGIGSLLSSSCNNTPIQSSIIGLNSPLPISSRSMPLSSSSSYNPGDMISAALTKYYQRQRLNN